MNERDIERFWAKVDRRGPDECWPWKAYKNSDGYGKLITGSRKDGSRRTVSAHRASFFIANGRWPLEGCHSCDCRCCCNPSHIWEGTHADNIADMDRKGRRRVFRGARHPRAKLTEEQALSVFALKAEGMTCVAIGALLGITDVAVGNILRGRTWTHLRSEALSPSGGVL